jgi:hypothetical protein
MAEYIERDQILGYMDLVVIHARGVAGNDSILKKVTDIVDNMRGLVAEAPAADVVPVVHGRWEHLEDGWFDLWRCSACGDEWFFEYDPRDEETLVKFCPNCGCRMNEDGE